MNEVFMAIDARILRDSFVARFDFYWVVVVLKRESQRVKKTIISFGHPFADKVVREMTIIADCDMMMTAFLPCVQMLLHRMAVCTALRIIA